MPDQSYLQLNILLSDSGSRLMEDLHHATIEVLEEVGVKVLEGESLILLAKAGAVVEGNVAKIPHLLLERALHSAPSVLEVFNRSGEKAMNLKRGNTYFGTGSDTPYVIDIETGLRRRSVKRDTVNAAIVGDALENIDFIMSMAQASDAPAGRTDRHHFEAMTLHTTKPIIFDAHNSDGLKDIINMAALAAGGLKRLIEKPYVIHYSEPTSPLMHSRNALEKLLTAAENHIPLVYAPAVMCGATGPVTTAGAVVVANAEILSGLVIHQLKSEGAPFIYGGGTPPLNMITAVCSYGDPQAALGCAAMVKLAQYYGLPSFTTAGCSDAHSFDQQVGIEVGFTLMTSAMAGGNLVHDIGYIGAGSATSLEQVVLCNEGIGAIKYLMGGIETDPRSLALEVIKKVGPGGHYLGEEHTMENFRNNMFFTSLFNRNNYDNWVASGSRDCQNYANSLVREILQWHEVPRLSLEVESRIKAVSSGDIGSL